MEHKFSPTSGYEPEPYVRTTATNCDHDATVETPTAATATTASGADENDDDPDDEHEYFFLLHQPFAHNIMVFAAETAWVLAKSPQVCKHRN